MIKVNRLIQKTTPLYSISVASRLTQIPIHTIRWLETNKLVFPVRTNGKHRQYSDENIELLLEIALLLEQKVNLAGIRAILLMKKTYNIKHLPTFEADENSSLSDTP